jgi:metal transporter CNNM
LDASGKKWVIFVDPSDQPTLVLDVHHFLRDALFDEVPTGPEAYWHRPIVVTDMGTRCGQSRGEYIQYDPVGLGRKRYLCYR